MPPLFDILFYDINNLVSWAQPYPISNTFMFAKVFLIDRGIRLRAEVTTRPENKRDRHTYYKTALSPAIVCLFYGKYNSS